MLKRITLLMTMATAPIQAATITASGQTTINWTFEGMSNPMVTFSIVEPPSVFSSTSFLIYYFADHRLEQGARPYGALNTSDISKVQFSSTYLRANTTIDESLTFGYSPSFLNANNLQNDAVQGTDNFLAIRWQDSSSQDHYGWLQFQLGTYSDGSVAISFLGGDVNNLASTSATAGVASIPEPSSLLLAGGAIALLPLMRRFRRAA